MRRRGRPPTDERLADLLVAAYVGQNRGANTVAAEYGVSKTTVYNVLERRGVGTRPRGGEVSFRIREQVLDEDGEELIYWTGFLLAESVVSAPGVFVAVPVCDLEHLIRLKKFFGAEGRISFWESPADRYHCGLVLRSSRLCERLKLPIADSPHFWRGCFDGSGEMFHDRLCLRGEPGLLRGWKRWVAGICEGYEVRGQDGGLWAYGFGYRAVGEAFYKEASVFNPRKRALCTMLGRGA